MEATLLSTSRPSSRSRSGFTFRSVRRSKEVTHTLTWKDGTQDFDTEEEARRR
jgi:hypothetical protein